MKILQLSCFLFFTFLLASCGTSNQVVSKSFLQKRKHNNGWFIKKNSRHSFQTKNEEVAENTDVQIKFYQPKVISIKTTETDDNLTESDEIASGNTSVRSTDEEINPRRIYDIPQQKESPRVINPKRFLRYTKNISVVQPNRFTEKDLSVDPRQEPFGLSGLLLSLVTVFAIILFLGEALEIVPLIIIAASVGFISLIFGIISLIRIIRQPEKLKGYWVAIASISAGAVLLVFGGILFYLLNYFVF